jgi:hypothetical protein
MLHTPPAHTPEQHWLGIVQAPPRLRHIVEPELVAKVPVDIVPVVVVMLPVDMVPVPVVMVPDVVIVPVVLIPPVPVVPAAPVPVPVPVPVVVPESEHANGVSARPTRATHIATPSCCRLVIQKLPSTQKNTTARRSSAPRRGDGSTLFIGRASNVPIRQAVAARFMPEGRINEP